MGLKMSDDAKPRFYLCAGKSSVTGITFGSDFTLNRCGEIITVVGFV